MGIHGIEVSARRAARHLRYLATREPADLTRVLRREADLWSEYRSRARGGPRVLIATGTGRHRAVTPVESMLAAALTLRGAEVEVLLCDRVLPACQEATFAGLRRPEDFVERGPKPFLCDQCLCEGRRLFAPLGLPVRLYSATLTASDAEEARALAQSRPVSEIETYELAGLKVGEHAMAGAVRYFAKASVAEEPYGEPVLRRYFEAALLTTFSVRRLAKTRPYDSACFHHGIYVPQGLVGEVMRQRGVRVINWNPAYRKQCFIFSHGDTYHHTLMDEPTEVWEGLDWTPELETELMDYLSSRWQGTEDWIWFHEKPTVDLRVISERLGIDLGKPTIGMLTNVVWDAQLHYPANAFGNMLEWVRATIEYFARRPELQLVIRVHPAEIRGTVPSRQRVVDEIARAFPTVPANVFVVGSESDLSTYALMAECDSAIIYGTKTGVELTSVGIPVVVAGEAWIRNKGVTLDARSREEYEQILDRLPLGARMDEATTRRARMYAYHFFFRRMIPIQVMEPTAGWPPYRLCLETLEQLLPNVDRGLDVVCNGILEGASFVYPAESQGVSSDG